MAKRMTSRNRKVLAEISDQIAGHDEAARHLFRAATQHMRRAERLEKARAAIRSDRHGSSGNHLGAT